MLYEAPKRVEIPFGNGVLYYVTSGGRQRLRVVNATNRRVVPFVLLSIPEGNLIIRIYVSRIDATPVFNVIASEAKQSRNTVTLKLVQSPYD